jgi:hypothetical protein
MPNENPTKEKFLKDLHEKFPMLESFRNHELKKVAHEIFNKSPLGKASSIIYFVIAVVSIFIYWLVFHWNVIIAILLGIVTWFAVTVVLDNLFIKILGIQKAVKLESEKNIAESNHTFQYCVGNSVKSWQWKNYTQKTVRA